MAIIELVRVTKEYTSDHVSFAALTDIDFSVERQEFVAIMGPSGSGKSTLMNIIGLLDRPTKGQYRLDGKEVGRLGDRAQALARNENIGFVFQTFNLMPRATVFDNVMLPLVYSRKNLGDRGKKVRELLAQVGLGERMHYRPNQLSGGERQRVAIARALVNEPTILLADEPTGNLDSKTGREILKLFQDLHQRGSTVIIVTHDAEVASVAQRIVHIRDGRITQTAEPRPPQKPVEHRKVRL
jgi:putative ABC transport system ATP-binding protein